MMHTKKVAVIGTGLSGLVTIKSCLEEGVEVHAFEKSTAIGGNWNFKEKEISVFRHTEMSSSRYATEFSDFPMPDNGTFYLDHAQYLEYLIDYMRHFDLERHITFNASIQSVQQQEGKWAVTVKTAESVATHLFDSVAVCTGLNSEPKTPIIEGMENFQGEICHSSTYKDNTAFHNKHVVVVGGGESSVDIVSELAEVASDVTVSLRRGMYILPKINWDMSFPFDCLEVRASFHLPRTMLRKYAEISPSIFLFMQRRKEWEIIHELTQQSGGGFLDQYIVKSNVFIETLMQPHVSLKPEIQSFEPDCVVFNDGSKLKADVVIFSTGFKVNFPFLPIEQEEWNWQNLYKKIYHPELPQIGFIGFARPDIGSMVPIAELQARYFAGISSGRLQFPEPAQLQKSIATDKEKIKKIKPLVYEQVTGIVPHVAYLYELAELIGCRPSLLKLLTKPTALWGVLFGTICGPHFRIHGPHANPAVSKQIKKSGLSKWKHVKTPMDFFSLALTIIGGIVTILLVFPISWLLSRLPGLSFLEPYFE